MHARPMLIKIFIKSRRKGRRKRPTHHLLFFANLWPSSIAKQLSRTTTVQNVRLLLALYTIVVLRNKAFLYRSPDKMSGSLLTS